MGVLVVASTTNYRLNLTATATMTYDDQTNRVTDIQVENPLPLPVMLEVQDMGDGTVISHQFAAQSTGSLPNNVRNQLAARTLRRRPISHTEGQSWTEQQLAEVAQIRLFPVE